MRFDEADQACARLPGLIKSTRRFPELIRAATEILHLIKHPKLDLVNPEFPPADSARSPPERLTRQQRLVECAKGGTPGHLGLILEAKLDDVPWNISVTPDSFRDKGKSNGRGDCLRLMICRC